MLPATTLPLPSLQTAFPDRMQFDVPLARYTAALVGGAADALLEVKTADELALAVEMLWAEDLPFTILGGGSNILVSDAGVRGVVLLNRAKKVRFALEDATVWAESGANFGALARQAATKSLSGLEWAAGIPGTVGGAVFGNAGAHDGDMAHNLIEAAVLDRLTGRQTWPVEKMQYEYRSSALKENPGQTIILSARLQLGHSPSEAIQAKMDTFLAHRHRTQPPGASMGSMFKNPPRDFAGRLIDAAGLKGTRVGGAEISRLHGNFFINVGNATASDVYNLLQLARQTVAEKFGVHLTLEIELIGEWQDHRVHSDN
ncbi:MAG: UDP-N-acetylmuramate dehydrogenase [Anaerolineales bacterium]|nr:UDP-N-acetylmuramate dehydrogenase [Anaerolineales bacterium]